MSAISPGPLIAISPGLAVPAVPLSRGAKAAREFEAQLIESLLDSMEKTFSSLPGQDNIPGADEYGHLGTQALAQGLADRGGFGIATMITRHFAAHEGKG
jgi:Rod binding domain-containing protein